MAEKQKRSVGRPRIGDGVTTPSQFRLADETLAELDWLMREIGLTTRADVVRLLSRQEAKKRGYAPPKKAVAEE